MGMKILIVDDDRVCRLLAQSVLRELPQAVLTEASDGLEAWEKLEEGLHPDVCLVDLLMPRMDGIELVQKIRAAPPLRNLPIIICSMVNDRFRMAAALSLDAAGYLIKPFTPAILLAEVRRVLRPASNLDAAAAQARQRSRLIISYYVHKMEGVVDQADRWVAQLRSAMAVGDRAGAAAHLTALKEATRANGLNRIADAAAKMEDRIYLESETVLNQGVDLIAAENRKLFLAVQKLADPDGRKEFHMESPSTATLHGRFVALFDL